MTWASTWASGVDTVTTPAPRSSSAELTIKRSETINPVTLAASGAGAWIDTHTFSSQSGSSSGTGWGGGAGGASTTAFSFVVATDTSSYSSPETVMKRMSVASAPIVNTRP